MDIEPKIRFVMIALYLIPTQSYASQRQYYPFQIIDLYTLELQEMDLTSHPERSCTGLGYMLASLLGW